MDDHKDSDAEAIANLRDIIQMFASPEVAQKLRLGIYGKGFDALELLELLEDLYPSFRPPVSGDEPPGMVRLPSDIADALILFYAKVSEVIDPRVLKRPADADLVASPTWKEIQREAARLDELLASAMTGSN